MTLKISRRVHYGTIVMRHGDKFVRCSRRGRVVGVYQAASSVVLLTDEGVHRYDRPRGVLVSGPVNVQFRGQKKRKR